MRRLLPVTTDDHVLAGYRKRFLHSRHRRQVGCSTILHPRDRLRLVPATGPAGHRGDAPRKDVLVDKPGITSFQQLAEVERTVAETRPHFFRLFLRTFQTPSTDWPETGPRRRHRPRRANRRPRPHRLNRAIRPPGSGTNTPMAASSLTSQPPDRPVHRFHQSERPKWR